jgi:predicted membrane protein (TIGR00267 family)
MAVINKTTFREYFTIIQRYLINTIFDTINSLIGVILGLYFSEASASSIFILSILSTAIALGISSGSSTYEAEYLEQLGLIKEIEQHLLTNFMKSESLLLKNAKKKGLAVGASNLLTPIFIAFSCVLVISLIPDMDTAIIGAIILLGTILFAAGVFFGKMNQLNPLRRGLRMLAIGGVTFVVIYFIGLYF